MSLRKPKTQRSFFDTGFVVEGLFEKEVLSHLSSFTDQIDFGEDGLLLRREVHQSGRTRSFANDSPISNSMLAEIGDRLIDLHGQHAHQSLLKVDQHLEVLDNFGVDQTLRDKVKTSYKNQFRSLAIFHPNEK